MSEQNDERQQNEMLHTALKLPALAPLSSVLCRWLGPALHQRRISDKHRAMGTKTCRWGILSTAGIAKKNWQAIRNSGNATLTAVASCGVAKAEAFIRECQAEAPFEQVPRALGGYEELISSPDVDAVHIPLPTGLRKEWVIRAAQAGKHVLVEKPAGCDVAGDRIAIQSGGLSL